MNNECIEPIITLYISLTNLFVNAFISVIIENVNLKGNVTVSGNLNVTQNITLGGSTLYEENGELIIDY